MIQLSHSDLALLLVVFWMLALGVAALLFGIFRRRAAAHLLILFGLFSILHGLRVAASLPIADIPGLSPRALEESRFILTYLVLLPLILLVEQFVGGGWRGTMYATVWLQATYTIVGIVADLVTGRPGTVMALKPYIVLVIGTAALGNILFAARHRGDIPWMLAVGFTTFLATVGVFNLAGIVHWPVSATIESVGFVVLVASLAYVVANRALETEARLVAVDREILSAQRIQTSILPREPPAIPGVAISARYRPMGAMAGDFYDFVRIDEGRAGVLVADVLGHGVPASLIASMVKVAFTAEASHADDPGAVLTGMNSTLVGLLSRGRDYVTACYVVVDPAAGEIVYAQAGHPPPVIQSAGGHVTTLDDGGTILGQFAGARYEGMRCRIDRHSRVLIYTDGVTEAISPTGEFFGMDRLKTLLTERRDSTVDEFADAVVETITAWQGVEQAQDDATIVVLDIQDQSAERARPTALSHLPAIVTE